MKIEERVMKVLQATPEQQAAIDRFFEFRPEPPVQAPAPTAAPPEFISKTVAASRLNKTVRTVDNWMKRGWLPYYKVGHTVVFKWDEIEAHLGRTCRVCRRG